MPKKATPYIDLTMAREETLARINQAAAVLDGCPIDALPAGLLECPDDCPGANGFKAALLQPVRVMTDHVRFTSADDARSVALAWGMTWVPRGVDEEGEEYYSVKMPAAMYEFVAAFDAGKYPDQSIGTSIYVGSYTFS